MELTWENIDRLSYKNKIFRYRHNKTQKLSKVFILDCEYCNDEFISQKIGGKYCSRKCRSKAKSGENSHFYNKKFTEEEIKKLSYKEIKSLYDKGIIKFTEIYDKKFKEYIHENKI